MKICILSMQRVENYGSILQAYALKKILEYMNESEVFFLDIILGENIEDKAKESNKSMYCNYSSIFRLPLYRKLKNRIQLELNKRKYHEFQNKFLNLKNKLQHYDLCVIGSDEVFNCLEKSLWGFTTQLFGDVIVADRVITYAASAGKTTYEELPNEIRNKIIMAMKNISDISVRDSNTYLFANKLSDKNIQVHYDPVLISDFTNEIKKYGSNGKQKGRYCIVYSYYHRFDNEEEISFIKKFCIEKGLTIYSIEGPQLWIKKHLNLNPFEVLECFKNAEIVITDTFHGTIFAAKYSKKFAIYCRENNKYKLLDIVEKLQISNHLVSENNKLEDIYKLVNNFEAINKIEKEQYCRTINYLKRYVNKRKE